ncbi:hypothetical protein BU14_0131s0001 [Porphyra umbilicalis]|uniref:Uncharacterized protein n=1 Tax=Porphyra umbilicalis TaxID=2786 RepID=A0A1X6PAC9_PORUM|nr:hypothetical protein BU14_0131s0001 [Porphyra umbilicalis]|eukprot:OSX77818.1 hypothetical protein BU14_0131s0001 [Porphyra umbilicalis]
MTAAFLSPPPPSPVPPRHRHPALSFHPPPPPPNRTPKPAARPPPAGYLLLLGGLTDGLLPTPWTPALAAAVGTAHGVATVQATLRSSYGGYGVASLATDAEDIAALVAAVRALPVGDSCGGTVGGGGGSGGGGGGGGGDGGGDSGPSRAGDAATAPRVAAAAALIARGRGGELLPRLAGSTPPRGAPTTPNDAADGAEAAVEHLDGGVPMTADRFFSLAAAAADGAADDLFSTDVDVATLGAGGLAALAPTPVLVLWSGADEFAADAGGDWAPGGGMPSRLVAAMGAGGGGGGGGRPSASSLCPTRTTPPRRRRRRRRWWQR